MSSHLTGPCEQPLVPFGHADRDPRGLLGGTEDCRPKWACFCLPRANHGPRLHMGAGAERRRGGRRLCEIFAQQDLTQKRLQFGEE